MPDSQDAVTAFLKSHGSNGHSTADEVVQTHAALVFLHSEEALKIKRAVRYDYMDASTLERRKALLLRELELNAPAAPGLYRDVVAITQQDNGALEIDGSGMPIEWVLRMRRFPAEAEMSRMADRGLIDDALADEMGTSVAKYHRETPPADLLGSALIGDIIDELDRVLSGMTDLIGGSPVEQFLDGARNAHGAQRRHLDERTAMNWVRRCHGDLHLRNIVIWKGVPTPIDALEFDERLGTCDVLYDLAFLLMDLEHRQLHGAANRVLNAYLNATGAEAHLSALSSLPLFLAIRAAIRAMVDIQTAPFQDDPQPLIEDGILFLRQANSFLTPRLACLVAVGGLSGSGKTTIARAVAPDIGAFPGAIHLRSDLERKALFGVNAVTRLNEKAYGASVTAKVYAALRRKARMALAAGHAVIVDAVYSAPHERALVERLATDMGRPFLGLWLEAETETRVERVTKRKKGASDADAAVARRQATSDMGDIDWIRIRTAGPLSDAVEVTGRLVARPDADAGLPGGVVMRGYDE
ncbi:MAG: AAA family ATPase [Pseudomonadota bacterium]